MGQCVWNRLFCTGLHQVLMRNTGISQETRERLPGGTGVQVFGGCGGRSEGRNFDCFVCFPRLFLHVKQKQTLTSQAKIHSPRGGIETTAFAPREA